MRNCRETVEKLLRNILIDCSVRSVCHEKTSTHFARISLRHEKTEKHFSLLSVSRKNIDALGINYTVSRENKTANHFDFARISVRHKKTADIELVVRKEDSTSNRRLNSLKFNLELYFFLRLMAKRKHDSRAMCGCTHSALEA